MTYSPGPERARSTNNSMGCSPKPSVQPETGSLVVEDSGVRLVTFLFRYFVPANDERSCLANVEKCLPLIARSSCVPNAPIRYMIVMVFSSFPISLGQQAFLSGEVGGRGLTSTCRV